MEFTHIVVLTFDGFASFVYVFMYLPQHTVPSNRRFSKTTFEMWQKFETTAALTNDYGFFILVLAS